VILREVLRARDVRRDLALMLGSLVLGSQLTFGRLGGGFRDLFPLVFLMLAFVETEVRKRLLYVRLSCNRSRRRRCCASLLLLLLPDRPITPKRRFALGFSSMLGQLCKPLVEPAFFRLNR
jgi:hypothetical protein